MNRRLDLLPRTGPRRRWARLRCIRAVLGVLALSCAAVAPSDGATIEIASSREGDDTVIRASARIHADPALAWRVVTDYARYPEFVPSLRSSRVVGRTNNRVTVEQSGSVLLGRVAFPIAATYEIAETPPSRIDSRAVTGSFTGLASSYRLLAQPEGVVLDYEGRIGPDCAFPFRFFHRVLEAQMAWQLQALAETIEREALRVRAPPP